MSNCHDTGISGECGIDCEAFLSGDCEEPDDCIDYLRSSKCDDMDPTDRGEMIAMYESITYEVLNKVNTSNSIRGKRADFVVINDPLVEYTNSGRFQFPNGDIIEIPGPMGSEWEKYRSYNYEDAWPSKYWDDVGAWGNVHVTHENGIIIFNEYRKRMDIENPRVLSTIKWKQGE